MFKELEVFFLIGIKLGEIKQHLMDVANLIPHSLFIGIHEYKNDNNGRKLLFVES